jgi:hypothetical protein
MKVTQAESYQKLFCRPQLKRGSFDVTNELDERLAQLAALTKAGASDIKTLHQVCGLLNSRYRYGDGTEVTAAISAAEARYLNLFEEEFHADWTGRSLAQTCLLSKSLFQFSGFGFNLFSAS